ncbi:MAG: hypothetical protein JST26_13400 [Bacteroidetes bacterium]|nr:hypothetical protein [Bacteroidota bacterium]
MVKHYLYIIFISSILFECTSDRNNPYSVITCADSAQKAFAEQLRKDSADCQKFLRDSIQLTGLFKAFCPNDTMQDIPFSRRKKYPFDTLITRSGDTTVYSFKVSNECCVKYAGKYVVSSDTLILSYHDCGDACDCYCDYILTYKIPDKKYTYKHIIIRTPR